MRVELDSYAIRWILAAALLMQIAGVFGLLQGFYLDDLGYKALGATSLLLGTLIRSVEYHLDHHLDEYWWKDGDVYFQDFRINEGEHPWFGSQLFDDWVAQQEAESDE